MLVEQINIRNIQCFYNFKIKKIKMNDQASNWCMIMMPLNNKNKTTKVNYKNQKAKLNYQQTSLTEL